MADRRRHDGGPVLRLPSTGPEPIPLDTALAAVLGYARGRRPVRFRSFDAPRWVQLPAFGWTRYDEQPVQPPGDTDVLIGEGLHGRLDRVAWTDVHEAMARVRPLTDEAVARAAGQPLWELPDDELSVLGEPGTVGAALREIGRVAGAHPAHVFAALHHRHPALVPHVTRSTRRAMLAHLEEGDSGVEAVVRREVRAEGDALDALGSMTAALLDPAGTTAPPSRLRLHDILLWLATTLRLAHAVALGRAGDEWRTHMAAADPVLRSG